MEQDSLITEMLAKRAFIIPKKKDGVYGENNFRRTEKTIYQFICDEFYVPMKAKEMAVVLSVPKSQRSELQEYLTRL